MSSGAASTGESEKLHGKAAAVECEFDVYSLDVFDTLLLRDLRSERSRFWQIAKLASRRFLALGIEVGTMALLKTRVEVQTQAYRALEATNPNGDIRLADMLDSIAKLLHLGPDGARILEDAEMEIELRCLRPNEALLARLARDIGKAKRVIAISDTYLSAAAVRHLLDTLAPGHPVEEVYTSADHNATKRGASLFGRVLEAEGVRPERMLHHGDDFTADHVMPRRIGVRTNVSQRARWVYFTRKLDGLVFRIQRPLALS